MKKCLRFCAVAAAAATFLGGSAPVVAKVDASATLSGLSLTLVDLNPGDGIAPSIQFLEFSGASVRTGVDDFSTESDGPWGGSTEAEPLATLNANWAKDFGQAFASTGNTGASASGSVSWPAAMTGYHYLNFDAEAAPLTSFSPFLLSPGSQLVVSGTVNLAASITAPEYQQAGDLYEYAHAAAVFRIEGASEAAPGGRQFTEWIQIVNADNHWWSATDAFTGSFSGSFSNTTGDWLQGFMGLRVLADGKAVAGVPPVLPPIPEPQSWALMLTGVAALGAWLRRKPGARRSDAQACV